MFRFGHWPKCFDFGRNSKRVFRSYTSHLAVNPSIFPTNIVLYLYSVLFVEPIVSNNQIRFPYYVPSAKRKVRKKGSLNAYVYKIYSRKMRKRKPKYKVGVQSRTSKISQRFEHDFQSGFIFFHEKWTYFWVLFTLHCLIDVTAQ